MKILINVPSLKLLGGVANHYLGLKEYWTDNVKYNTIGKRSNKSGSGLFWLPYDILKFIIKLLIFRPDVVLLNPSLGKSALKRDFIFLNIARYFKFKIVVFIHGFDWDYAINADKGWISKNLNKASLVLVLAKAFIDELCKWNVNTPIALTTTKVNEKMLDGYDPTKSRTGIVNNILFLARIEKAKGVYIAVDSYDILKHKYNWLTLTIVGDGKELKNLQEYVKEKNIPDVIFTGRLDGQDVVNAYKNADLFSSASYGEGMPTTVLEAMAFGLPIFTRNVGGLVDFFENRKMGYITDSVDSIDFANAMEEYIRDRDFTKHVSDYNAQYAKKYFYASIVAKHLQNYCHEIVMMQK